MNKPLIIAFGLGGTLCLGLLVLGIMFVSISNKEVGIRNQIVAKQKDNESEFDNMFKKIKQVAQVSEKEADAIKKIVVGHAEARAGQGGGTLFTMVTEAVPNQTPQTYAKLANIVTGSRDAWTMRQKELLDLKRAHDNMIDMFPSSIIVGSRGKIYVQIITSGKAADAMATGKDDDVDVFSN